jgi:hypothetical protein
MAGRTSGMIEHVRGNNQANGKLFLIVKLVARLSVHHG